MMNQLINLTNHNGTIVVSSRQIAKNFCKEHNDTKKRIRELIGAMGEKSHNYFMSSEYKDSLNRTQEEYLMNRDGFSLLVMGFTGAEALQWKLKYIDAFNKMEVHIKNQVPQLSEKQKAILSVYDGGEQALIGAKKLAEIEVKQVIEELEPTLEEYKQFIECPNGCVFVDEYSKNLGIGRNKFYEILRELKILQSDVVEVDGAKYKGRRQNTPYQQYMKYFEVKFAVKNDRKFSVTLINNDGQTYLYKKLKKEGYLE